MLEVLLYAVISILVSAMFYLAVTCISAFNEICEFMPTGLYARSREGLTLKICAGKLNHTVSEVISPLIVIVMGGAIYHSQFPIYAHILPVLCITGFFLRKKRAAFRWIPGVNYIEYCVAASRHATDKLHEGLEHDEAEWFSGIRANNVIDSEINAWGEIYEDLVKLSRAIHIAIGFIAFFAGTAFALIALA